MYDRQQPIPSSSSERDEALTHILSGNTLSKSTEDQRLLDYLLGTGFTHNEAIKLVYQRTHLYENSEMRQRVHDDARIQFVRWLYEHGEIAS